MQILKQSTAIDVLIGPFVDSTDGDTEETALTISAADVLLSKNGQALTLKTDATACAHDANGMYNCELDATDTNTVGNMVLFVHEAGALAVRHEFQIVEEAVYVDLFAASGAGYAGITALSTVDTVVDGIQTDLDNGTDGLGAIKTVVDAIPTTAMRGTDSAATATALTTAQNDLDIITGASGVNLLTATQASIDAIEVDTGTTLDGKIDTLDTNVDAVLVDTGTTIPGTITTLQADTDDIQTRIPAALVSGKMDSDAVALGGSTTSAANLAASALGIVTGECEGTPSTTVVQTDLAEATDDHYIGRVVVFTSGDTAGEATDITDYTGATGTITVTLLTTAPAATDTFVIV